MALTPLADAQALVLAACHPLAAEEVPLADALGLVLAADIAAPDAVPPFDNTAMDGFAVRAVDTAGATEESPVRLLVTGTQPAGRDRGLVVRPGTAVRIMTGAPMPAGADAVVMVERSVPVSPGGTGEGSEPAGDPEVDLTLEVAPGTSVRRAGDDLRSGQQVLVPGSVLGPAALGVLASVGLDRVPAHRRPVVGVFSTGDELVPPGRPLHPGEIRDSNRRSLLALLERDGLATVDLGLVPDDEELIAEAIHQGVSGCDALLTSGGVSMGDFDFVKVVLDRLADMRWLQLAIKPAKPFAFGVVDDDGRSVPVFGLPGNPVSSLVSYELLARPGLRAMLGRPDPIRSPVGAVAAEDLRRRPDGKVHYARAVCRWSAERGAYEVRSAGGQGSHQLAAMAAADALAVLPDGDGVPDGGPVDVLLLG